MFCSFASVCKCRCHRVELWKAVEKQAPGPQASSFAFDANFKRTGYAAD
jgi:hypothetical protein